MIRRFTYGIPFDTEAVLNKPTAENCKLPYFEKKEKLLINNQKKMKL